MTVAEKLTAIAENVQKVFDAGKAAGSAGGGGTSASGVKVAIFDVSKLNEYEKIVVDESTYGFMFKLSDEVPTYDELCGGYLGKRSKLVADDGSIVADTSSFAVLDESNLSYNEELQSTIVGNSEYISMSAAGAEMFGGMIGVNITPGLYASTANLDWENLHEDNVAYAVLIWGFE